MKYKHIWASLFLSTIFSSSFAAGIVHHQIINNTPYELYVSVRQQFQYPIEGCLGPVASGETKECDGAFEQVDSKFIIELIKKGDAAEELKGAISLKTSAYKNLLFTWTLKLDKNELDASVKVENKAIKWSSKSSLKLEK